MHSIFGMLVSRGIIEMTVIWRILITHTGSAYTKSILTFILIILFDECRPDVHEAGYQFSASDKKVVDNLVKKWAPIVWLAPGEQFLPLDVNEFLENVHAHHEQMNDAQSVNNQFYSKQDADNSITNPIKYAKQSNDNVFGEQKRTSNFSSVYSENLLNQIPLGESSEKTYLVTNDEIDELLFNKSSFIYGKDPNRFKVPIYAVVNICSRTRDENKEAYEAKQNKQYSDTQIPSPLPYQQFIPIPRADGNVRFYDIPVHIRLNKTYYMNVRKKRETEDKRQHSALDNSKKEIKSNFIANLADNVKFSLDDNADNQANELDYDPTSINIPSFQVTYWMFYPYSQGKAMCTMSLGPLGRIPIPLIFGICMGSKKDFGSHVGDWEHMSLLFKGSVRPDSMYVSAHDAGAYYSYNDLTETFEFQSQETRKGILQRPNFPKTVTTSSNHPVLFAALGSHGLWTAPGKHRFVRVPRLYDVNGFGMPWYTWKIVEITYENIRSQRSLPPKWLEFKGKWGNPKSNCHPLRRIGLNFCEYTDGPTGIPLKPAHFRCSM